jgi:hypothetical protein
VLKKSSEFMEKVVEKKKTTTTTTWSNFGKGWQSCQGFGMARRVSPSQTL